MITKPEDIEYRNCGYCGCKFLLNQEMFLAHVHLCEVTPKENV